MMRRSMRVALTAIAGAATMLPLAAGPAAAAPTGCTAGGGSVYATAYCSGGTGSYQAWAQCRGTVWPYNWAFVQSGWKSAGSGQTAVVFCPISFDGYVVWTRGVSLRN
jgi:hypothetical protein